MSLLKYEPFRELFYIHCEEIWNKMWCEKERLIVKEEIVTSMDPLDIIENKHLRCDLLTILS